LSTSRNPRHLWLTSPETMESFIFDQPVWVIRVICG
jgi:hypothetical protein